MKYSKKKVKQCADYVEQNGLMQRFGSTLKDFCYAMDISQETYYEWLQKTEFAESLEKAKDVFSNGVTLQAEKALMQRVRGYKSQTLDELGEIDTQTRKFTTKRAKRVTKDVPPDVGACIFVLTNQDPDKWKNRQNSDVTLRKPDGKPMTIDEINAEIDRLEKLESAAASDTEITSNEQQ